MGKRAGSGGAAAASSGASPSKKAKVPKVQQEQIVPIEPSAAQIVSFDGSALQPNAQGQAASMSPWGVLPLPDAFPEDDASLSTDEVYKIMKGVASFVVRMLPDFMKERAKTNEAFASVVADRPLHEYMPLALPESAGAAMTSYKFPWSKTQAVQSLRTNGLFEAAANLTWLNPFPVDADAQIIAGDPPKWSNIVAIANSFMSLDADQAATLAASQGQTPTVKRLLFPVVVPAHVEKIQIAEASSFNAALPVVAGHVYVLGWYLGMYKAIGQSDAPRVAALWQMALTASVQARVGLTKAQLALWSIKTSEIVRSLDLSFVDGFPAFALKACALLSGEKVNDSQAVKYLTDAGVTFCSHRPNKSMVQTILAFRSTIDADGLELLREIETEHGREVLNSGYVKISRLIQLAVEASKVLDVDSKFVVNYTLGALKFGLNVKCWGIQPGDVTVAYLDRTRDGTPGFVPRTLGRLCLVQYVRMLTEDLRPSSQCASVVADMDKLMHILQSHKRFEKTFDPSTQEDGGDEGHVTDAFKQEHMKTKAGNEALDFFFDLYSGEYEEQMSEFLKGQQWKDLIWSNFDVGGFQNFIRQINIQRTVVISDDAAPAATTRTLQRYASDAADATEKQEMQKEREEHWKNACGMRRKIVNFGYGRNFTEKEIQSVYEKSAVYNFQGTLGKAHRVFLFAADLLHEPETTPWSRLPEWKADLAQAALRFMLTHAGPADVLVFCDGRSRQCRIALEQFTADARNLSELWVVFKPTPRLGRRVWYGSDNKEMILVSSPVPRTQLAVKERSDVGACSGESTTHDASYTGVEPVAWGQMAILSADDKARVLGHPVQTPRPQLFDTSLGHPLFWGERKSIGFWRTLFEDLDGKAVVDTTPGSGLASRAALELGIPYFGIARNSLHAKWLNNVADRACCQEICKQGTPLFHQDLATLIAQHFQDILDAQKTSDESEDNAPEECDNLVMAMP